MPTNLGIDEALLIEALRVGGHRTKKATVNEALAEYIAARKRMQGLRLLGTIDFDRRSPPAAEEETPVILLDTSVLKAAYARRAAGAPEPPPAGALRHLIETGAALGIPAIVVQEVLAGVVSETQFRQLQTHLEAFRILPATPQDHVAAAKLAAACSARRIPCSAIEALAVAQTVASRSRLYTLNPAMPPIAGLAGARLYKV